MIAVWCFWSVTVAALCSVVYRLGGCPAIYDGDLNPEHGVRDLICTRARALDLMGSIEMVSFSSHGRLRTFRVAAQGPASLILQFVEFLQTLVKVRGLVKCQCASCLAFASLRSLCYARMQLECANTR